MKRDGACERRLFYYQKFRVGYKRHHNVTLLQSRKI